SKLCLRRRKSITRWRDRQGPAISETVKEHSPSLASRGRVFWVMKKPPANARGLSVPVVFSRHTSDNRDAPPAGQAGRGDSPGGRSRWRRSRLGAPPRYAP